MNQAPFQTRPQGAFRMHAQQSHPRIRAVWQSQGAARNICYKRRPREYPATAAAGDGLHARYTLTGVAWSRPHGTRQPTMPQPLGTTQARRLGTQKVGDNAGLCTALVHKGSTGNESRNARFRRFAPRPREPHADDAATPEKTTLLIGEIESTPSIFATFWLHGLDAS